MSVDAGAVLGRVASAAVSAQAGLDHRAKVAAARWDDTGIPPWAGAYADLRADLRCGVSVAPRTAACEPSRLLMVGDRRLPARFDVAIALRHTERPSDARED